VCGDSARRRLSMTARVRDRTVPHDNERLAVTRNHRSRRLATELCAAQHEKLRDTTCRKPKAWRPLETAATNPGSRDPQDLVPLRRGKTARVKQGEGQA